jgi:hypothetical protein
VRRVDDLGELALELKEVGANSAQHREQPKKPLRWWSTRPRWKVLISVGRHGFAGTCARTLTLHVVC